MGKYTYTIKPCTIKAYAAASPFASDMELQGVGNKDTVSPFGSTLLEQIRKLPIQIRSTCRVAPRYRD